MSKSYEIQFLTDLDVNEFEERAKRWALAVGLTNPDRAKSAFVRYAIRHVDIPVTVKAKEQTVVIEQ